MSYTPGPWFANFNNIYWEINIPWDDEKTADRYAPTLAMVTNRTGANSEANARLIAAAPELLDALKETLDEAIGWFDYACGYQEGDENKQSVLAFVLKARAAIQKAEGKS